jgi:hypothetical protein
VEQVNFDPVLCVLRIKGKNTLENQHVRVRGLLLLMTPLNGRG